MSLASVGVGALRIISKKAKTWHGKEGVPDIFASVVLTLILGVMILEVDFHETNCSTNSPRQFTRRMFFLSFPR